MRRSGRGSRSRSSCVWQAGLGIDLGAEGTRLRRYEAAAERLFRSAWRKLEQLRKERGEPLCPGDARGPMPVAAAPARPAARPAPARVAEPAPAPAPPRAAAPAPAKPPVVRPQRPPGADAVRRSGAGGPRPLDRWAAPGAAERPSDRDVRLFDKTNPSPDPAGRPSRGRAGGETRRTTASGRPRGRPGVPSRSPSAPVDGAHGSKEGTLLRAKVEARNSVPYNIPEDVSATRAEHSGPRGEVRRPRGIIGPGRRGRRPATGGSARPGRRSPPAPSERIIDADRSSPGRSTRTGPRSSLGS